MTGKEDRKEQRVVYLSRHEARIVVKPAPLTVQEGGLTKMAPQGIQADVLVFGPVDPKRKFISPMASYEYTLEPNHPRYWEIRHAIEGQLGEGGKTYMRPPDSHWLTGWIWTEASAREKAWGNDSQNPVRRRAIVRELADLRKTTFELLLKQVDDRRLLNVELEVECQRLYKGQPENADELGTAESPSHKGG